MDSGAALAVAAFAILVLSSMGHPPPKTGPLCSDCASQCAAGCINSVYSSCANYCVNPNSARLSCEWQVLQVCMMSSCCDGNCTHDCSSVAKDGCQNVPGTKVDCDACMGSLSQYCFPTCYNSNCNSTCVKKEDGY